MTEPLILTIADTVEAQLQQSRIRVLQRTVQRSQKSHQQGWQTRRLNQGHHA